MICVSPQARRGAFEVENENEDVGGEKYMVDVEKVISYFKKVCSIPRASGDETAIGDYIVDFARKEYLDVIGMRL